MRTERGVPTHTFVLRVWLEPGAAGDEPPEWRGEIRDVLSGTVRYFRRFEALPAVVAELSREAGGGEGPGGGAPGRALGPGPWPG